MDGRRRESKVAAGRAVLAHKCLLKAIIYLIRTNAQKDLGEAAMNGAICLRR